MNEMDSLENRLGSWKPRRPSANIERRLFPVPSAGPELLRMLNWLAPATICLLVVLAAFRQENGFPVEPPQPNPVVAMMLSNQNAVPFLAADPSRIERNLLPPTFEFTNRNGSALNTGSTSSTKPNQ